MIQLVCLCNQDLVESQNRKLVYFIKVHATWPVLCHYAEELNMRAPLQVNHSLHPLQIAQPQNSKNNVGYFKSYLGSQVIAEWVVGHTYIQYCRQNFS